MIIPLKKSDGNRTQNKLNLLNYITERKQYASKT
nr:MAG TPA: hypothetical protein [Caudoviricetes sp.]